MEKKLKAKWIEALRSGSFVQARGFLKNSDGHCCIGVLAEVQGMPWSRMGPTDSDLQTSWLPTGYRGGLSTDQMNDLANMNDGGKTFPEIADYIEENL